jgi:hypothetical protein
MQTLLPIWYSPQGDVISCTEKIKVMEQNMAEVDQILRSALKHFIILEHDLPQVKKKFIDLIHALEPFPNDASKMITEMKQDAVMVEVVQVFTDALEDAVLMGCDPFQVKDFFIHLLHSQDIFSS